MFDRNGLGTWGHGDMEKWRHGEMYEGKSGIWNLESGIWNLESGTLEPLNEAIKLVVVN